MAERHNKNQTMVVTVEIGYGQTFSEKTKGMFLEWNPTAKFEDQQDDNKGEKQYSLGFGSRSLIVPLERFASAAFNMGLKFEVIGVVPMTSEKEIIEVMNDALLTSHQLIAKLGEKVEAITSGDNLFNKKVNVHLPGLGLLEIDEVKLMEDCCTDQLKKQIESGFRIIAVCPQPDQRRPDYILGRTQN